jgi:hypothetical protein
MKARKFSVVVDGNIEPLLAGDRSVIFHAINKSGSKALALVLRAAYDSAGRGEEFVNPSTPNQRELIENNVGPGFFWAHYLYGAVTPRADRVFITVFRNPLPRVVSIYQWLKNKRLAAGTPEAEIVPLEQFIKKSHGVHHSIIAQFGAGYGSDHKTLLKKYSKQDLYERSLENIERDVHWFGLAELFEETIFTTAAICGLKTVPVWKRDVRNPNRPMVWDLSEDIKSAIQEQYRFDFMLYEHVLRIFKERMAGLRLGGDFELYKEACRGEYKDRIIPGAAAGTAAASS